MEHRRFRQFPRVVASVWTCLVFAPAALCQVLHNESEAAAAIQSYLQQFGHRKTVSLADVEIADGEGTDRVLYHWTDGYLSATVCGQDGALVGFLNPRADEDVMTRPVERSNLVIKDENQAFARAHAFLTQAGTWRDNWTSSTVKGYAWDPASDPDSDRRRKVYVEFVQGVPGLVGWFNNANITFDALTGEPLMYGAYTGSHYSSPSSTISLTDAVQKAKEIVDRQRDLAKDDPYTKDSWFWPGDEAVAALSYRGIAGPIGDFDEDGKPVPLYGSTWACQQALKDPRGCRQCWGICVRQTFGLGTTKTYLLYLDAETGEPLQEVARASGIGNPKAPSPKPKPEPLDGKGVWRPPGSKGQAGSKPASASRTTRPPVAAVVAATATLAALGGWAVLARRGKK